MPPAISLHLGYRVTVTAPSFWGFLGTQVVSIGVYFDAAKAKAVGEESIQDHLRWPRDHLSEVTFEVEPVLLVKIGNEWREVTLGTRADDVEEA